MVDREAHTKVDGKPHHSTTNEQLNRIKNKRNFVFANFELRTQAIKLGVFSLPVTHQLKNLAFVLHVTRVELHRCHSCFQYVADLVSVVVLFWVCITTDRRVLHTCTHTHTHTHTHTRAHHKMILSSSSNRKLLLKSWIKLRLPNNSEICLGERTLAMTNCNLNFTFNSCKSAQYLQHKYTHTCTHY